MSKASHTLLHALRSNSPPSRLIVSGFAACWLILKSIKLSPSIVKWLMSLLSLLFMLCEKSLLSLLWLARMLRMVESLVQSLVCCFVKSVMTGLLVTLFTKLFTWLCTTLATSLSILARLSRLLSPSMHCRLSTLFPANYAQQPVSCSEVSPSHTVLPSLNKHAYAHASSQHFS